MIPRHITLTNFLSYQQASLDFAGLHVACIAGPNGAGKSSLLEAIGWAIWGQSRVASDDHVIYQGATEARVAFVFQRGEEVYRIIRSRHRVQGTSLEFQVKTEAGYRVLTQGGIRLTQRLICRCLKLDYDTFVNSAYLRQGRADDFMLKPPAERKEILAGLLQLDRYDNLAERAREQAHQARAEVLLRQAHIKELAASLKDSASIQQRQAELQEQLARLEQLQTLGQEQLQQLKQSDHTYQQHQQQLQLLHQRRHHLQEAQQQTTAMLADLTLQVQHCQQVLAEASAIAVGMEELRALELEEEQLNQLFEQYQDWQQQRQALHGDYAEQLQTLAGQRQRYQDKLANLETELQELNQVLQQAEAVRTASQQLTIAKARLKHLDALELQTGPLLQRQRQIQAQLSQEQTRLQTRINDLSALGQQLHNQQAQQSQLVASAQELGQALSQLQRRRAYQEQVREKGQERRSFVEALQATQRHCQTQIARVDQKLYLLSHPQAACPVCDRPLDDHHRSLVEDRHRLEQQDLQEQIWVIGEQLAVSEREIQVLRQEYRAVEVELEAYAPTLHQQGQVAAQMASQLTLQQQLQQVEAEIWELQQCLDHDRYAPDLQMELRQIQQTLTQLAYDDRDHALLRGQVNRLRWADIKHHELTQGQRRQKRLLDQRQQLFDQIATLAITETALQESPLKQSIDQLDTALEGLNYQLEHHRQVRRRRQAAQCWQQRQQQLDWAEQQHPLLSSQQHGLETRLAEQHQDLDQVTQAITQLQAILDLHSPRPERLATLETQIQQQQQQREDLLAQLGALGQACTQLNQLDSQYQHQHQELEQLQQRYQVYHELAQAFGRDGLQSLMIENLLPQLETETNQILGRLSNHQMHVRFATQRPGKRRRQKSVETLDILIADDRGTRPYETYSGGEAFRVNFALRLALARLLAQRSGIALQLLIIDEGFGTQDQAGCDRLIAAINAIAGDFACILTVTHIPHFREAFQARIDISKTATGSHLSLSL
ncbi:MAG: SMC family ATPase [Cyanobacteria bacterium REEB459]|nr:SMC family ATPase [Cyanobacteria bacterium REEB459]